VLSVGLSVSRHLSIPLYFSDGPDSSKYAGINGAMNDVMTYHMFHLLCLANTFRFKTQTKKHSAVLTLPYVPPPNKERLKQLF
jgi:hypothetical protein